MGNRLSRPAAIIFLVLLLSWAGVAQKNERFDAKIEAVKVLEVGRATERVVTSRMKEFWKSYDSKVELYIINYGTNREIARRERLITNTINFRHYDGARITLVRGGLGPARKQFFGEYLPVPNTQILSDTRNDHNFPLLTAFAAIRPSVPTSLLQ